MKVIIVTVFRSTNCGSYLQAYALKRWMEDRGCEVDFLDLRLDKEQIFIDALSHMRDFNISAIKDIVKVQIGFRPFFRKMNIVSALKAKKKNYDLEIIGGDEIWNMSRRKFHDISVRGKQIYARNVISYAPSINGAKREDFQSEESKICFQNLNAVSVRDAYSQYILGELTDRKIEMTLDPTFLFSREDYEKIVNPLREEKFLLLYVSFDIQQEWVTQIQRMCREENLKIVSYGWRQKFADKHVIANPDTFIQYFLEAEYIITNSFHGTAFSINFRKKFVAIDVDSQKVKELLKQFDCEDRQSKNPQMAIKTLKKNIDDKRVRELQAQYISNSEEYLIRNI